VITWFGCRAGVSVLGAAVLAVGLAALPLVSVSAQEQAAPAAPPPAAAGARAQFGASNADTPHPWTVNCSSNPQTGDLICAMSQTLVATLTNQRLVGASVYRPEPSAAAVLRLSLPHGILLQKGVDVWIDEGTPTNYPIIIADANGSYADVELGADMLTRLQGGGVLHLGVTGGNGERLEFSLSLKGFTAAFAKL